MPSLPLCPLSVSPLPHSVELCCKDYPTSRPRVGEETRRLHEHPRASALRILRERMLILTSLTKVKMTERQVYDSDLTKPYSRDLRKQKKMKTP